MSERLKDQDRVKSGETLDIGGRNVRVTSGVGYRKVGNRDTEYSVAIDYVTDDKKAVALVPGKIVSVHAQPKSGSSFDVAKGNYTEEQFKEASKGFSPNEGKAGGFYVTVQNDDGTYSRYMHLSPITKEEAQGLIGKKLGRGDVIHDYSQLTGSGTAPHVKVRVFTDLDKPSTETALDPTPYLRGQFSGYTTDPHDSETYIGASTGFTVYKGADVVTGNMYSNFAKDIEKEKIKEKKAKTDEERAELEKKKQEDKEKKEGQKRQQSFLNEVTSNREQRQQRRASQPEPSPYAKEAGRVAEIDIQSQLPNMPNIWQEFDFSQKEDVKFQDGGLASQFLERAKQAQQKDPERFAEETRKLQTEKFAEEYLNKGYTGVSDEELKAKLIEDSDKQLKKQRSVEGANLQRKLNKAAENYQEYYNKTYGSDYGELSKEDAYKKVSQPGFDVDKYAGMYNLGQPKNEQFVSNNQSTASRAWDVVTNPLTAFKYSVQTGDFRNMPSNINAARMAGQDVDPDNLVGNALNTTVNLFDAGDKVVRNVGEGNYGTAALEAMRFLPGARVNTGAGKYLTTQPLRNATSSVDDVGRGFKSEIDWGKWNPNTPKRADLMKEFTEIERRAKADGTWMKDSQGNPARLPNGELATPEQWVQSQGKGWEKAYGAKGFNAIDHTYIGRGRMFNKGVENQATPLLRTTDDPLYGQSIMSNPDGDMMGYYTHNSGMSPDADMTIKDLLDKYKFTRANLNEGANYYGQKIGVHQLALPKVSNAIKTNAKNEGWSRIADQALYKKIKDLDPDIVKGNLEGMLTTDDIAKFIDHPLNASYKRAIIDNVNDGALGTVIINKQVPGNYHKSLWGNVGDFDLSNPDIYKAIVPAAVATGAATSQEYQTGGEIELELTPEEIEWYKSQGYNVEVPKGKYQPGGTVKPYITSNPNDPRIQAYGDSLANYQTTEKLKSAIESARGDLSDPRYIKALKDNYRVGYGTSGTTTDEYKGIQMFNFPKPKQEVILKREYKPNMDTDVAAFMKTAGMDNSYEQRKKMFLERFPDEAYSGTAPQNIKLLKTIKEEMQSIQEQPDEVPPQEVYPEKEMDTLPTDEPRTFDIQEWRQEWVKDPNSPTGGYWKRVPAGSTKYLKGFEDGGLFQGVEVDPMGLWNGKRPVVIPSNEITMKGVNYDVLGISDEGDRKIMKPGRKYKFKGSKVLEIPLK